MFCSFYATRKISCGFFAGFLQLWGWTVLPQPLVLPCSNTFLTMFGLTEEGFLPPAHTLDRKPYIPSDSLVKAIGSTALNLATPYLKRNYPLAYSAYKFAQRNIMPYARSYSRRTYGRKRASYSRGKKYRRSMAYSSRYPRKGRATVPVFQPRAEVKSKYTNFTYSNIPSTGQLTELGTLAQGTTQITRQGTVAKYINFQLGLDLTIDYLTATNKRIRVIIFKWNQGYISPTAASILEDVSTLPWISPYNQDTARHYTIMRDYMEELTVNVNTNQAGKSSVRTIPINTQVTFQTTAADSGDVRFFLLLVTDKTTTGASSQISWRLNFYDL